MIALCLLMLFRTINNVKTLLTLSLPRGSPSFGVWQSKIYKCLEGAYDSESVNRDIVFNVVNGDIVFNVVNPFTAKGFPIDE